MGSNQRDCLFPLVPIQAMQIDKVGTFEDPLNKNVVYQVTGSMPSLIRVPALWNEIPPEILIIPILLAF